MLAGRAQLRDPWRTLQPWVEVAAAAELGGDPAWGARVLLIDPAVAQLSVQFDADRPTIAQWRTRFPTALALANGSFYSADERREVRPTCDLVLAGKLVRGAGCRRKDALFFGARAAAPKNQAAPRPPAHGPPDASPGSPGARAGCPAPSDGPRLVAAADFHPEDWTEALKSFPALVRQCEPACPGPHYCQEHSRTAALAQLRDGSLILFASQWAAVRRDVGRFLAESLGAVEAVNLDGGPEATLVLRGEALENSIGTPGTGLPLVLVVLPR
ncbi:MAG: hypothetical protein NVS4B10_00090 [Myxococcales bacterium]